MHTLEFHHSLIKSHLTTTRKGRPEKSDKQKYKISHSVTHTDKQMRQVNKMCKIIVNKKTVKSIISISI